MWLVKDSWEGHLASPGPSQVRDEFRGFVPRIKLAATKLITFGYFQLVAAQLSRARAVGWARAAGGRGRQLFACSAKKVAQHPLTAFKAPAAKSEREREKPPKSETKRSFSGEKLRAANGSDKTTTTKNRRRIRAKGELQRSAVSDGAR